MRTKMIKYFVAVTSMLIVSCSSSAVFNQRAYEQDVSVKVDALALMDKADQPYSNYTDKVSKLKLNVEKAYQYAKGLPNNNETMAQWEIIKDPQRNSLIGFLERWKSEGTLNRAFIEAGKKLISQHFDQVIELESGKRK